MGMIVEKKGIIEEYEQWQNCTVPQGNLCDILYEKVRSSLVHEFICVQREQERGTCGPTVASGWLQQHRPKVALHPSMTDYYETCKHMKEQLSRNQAVMNLSQQSGNATESDLRALEEEREVGRRTSST